MDYHSLLDIKNTLDGSLLKEIWNNNYKHLVKNIDPGLLRTRKRGNRAGVRVNHSIKNGKVPLPAIVLTNAQSIRNKLDELHGLLQTKRLQNKSQLICITESWLTPDISHSRTELDGYEQFLYFETGSNIFTWPKSTDKKTSPLHSVSSSLVKTWLGSENSNDSNYGGQLLSASLFDSKNEYGLINLVPKHIIDNNDNDFYKTFTHMIGHHFDHIWTHIKHTTEINNSHHKRGVSKDLVYFTLKSLGLCCSFAPD